MAIDINFTFSNNTKALKIFNSICLEKGFDENNIDGETKQEFIKRITIKMWKVWAMAGMAKENIAAWQGEFDDTSIE